MVRKMSVPISNGVLIHNINKSVGKTNGKSTRRKSVDDVITDDVLKKVREIACNDAENGDKAEPRTAIIGILDSCRRQVAPVREKLFAEAQQQMNKDIQQSALKKGKHPETLLEYLLELEGKFDSGDGSYEGQHSPSGHTYMKIYDENGDLAGTYSSNSGFKVHHTPSEKQVERIIVQEYKDAFAERYNDIKSQENSLNTSSFDTYA